MGKLQNRLDQKFFTELEKYDSLNGEERTISDGRTYKKDKNGWIARPIQQTATTEQEILAVLEEILEAVKK